MTSARETRTAAIVGVLDGRGRVLVVHQRGGAYAGAWLLPGGRVAPGERPRDAAVREAREETGGRLRQVRPIAAYRVAVAGEAWIVHLYRGTLAGPLRPEAGGALRWADPGGAGLHPSLRRELADLGLRREDPRSLARALAGHGILMERLR